MKIFFNRVPRHEPYGGGNQFLVGIVKALTTLGHNIIYHLEEDIDLIFMMDPRPGDIGYSLQHIAAYKQSNPRVKIVHRVNECDKRKGTNDIDRLLLAGMNISDNVIFISQWLKSYFEERGFSKKASVIYNGCNTDHFKPLNKVASNEKIKLVTHHWSDNWMKGFDLYTKLDEYLLDFPDVNIEFTYIGRYYKSYQPSATKIIEPTHGIELGDKLREHDIYITASRFEPCGMHHVEGSASGLPVIFHKDGGGINELCKNHGESFENFDEFLVALEKIKSNMSAYKEKINYEYLSLTRCIDSYISVIENLK